MKGRAIIPLVLGLGVGIFAVKMFVDVLKKARGAGAGETVQVIRARADIAPTSEITEAMIETVAVPKQLVPKLVFTDSKEVIGRVTTQLIPQEMPIVPSSLAPKGTPAGMAAKIKEGYRAVAVKTDETTGVAGWIKPGSRVDVVAVMTVKRGGGSEVQSRVILQNVEVLAVGQDIGNTGETAASIAKSVTLLVKPEAVTRLHLASTKGTIRLAMRSQSDEGGGDVASTSDKELWGDEGSESEPKRGGSPLNGMLSKLPKIPAKATDKGEGVPNLVTSALPVQAANRPWVVDVIAGSNVYQVMFDGERKDAQRLGDNSGRNPRRSLPLPSPTPVRTGKPEKTTEPSEDEPVEIPVE